MGKKVHRFHIVISEYEEIFLEYFCIKLNSTTQLRIPIAGNIQHNHSFIT